MKWWSLPSLHRDMLNQINSLSQKIFTANINIIPVGTPCCHRVQKAEDMDLRNQDRLPNSAGNHFFAHPTKF